MANLITKNSFVNLFAPCPNVVATDDPQLGPLQDNAGPTPTMAITSTSSSAFGAADLATSLATDQRYVKRPQFHGPSLGAYEPCAIPAGITPCIGSSFLPPDTTTVQLTVQVSPAGGGTTSPAAGIYQEPQDTVIPLTATPNTGYAFTSWTGNVADPTSPSTTVTMSQAQTVTANFVPVASAFSPAKVWIGLKNSDDVGQRLDLLAEVFVNATKVGQGELDNVGSGRSGFSNAILETIPLGLTGDSVGATSGAQLKIRVSARRTCTGARHASGTARLWYNGLPVDSGDTRDAGSRFGATIGGTAKDYFLRSGFALSTTAGSNRSYVDAFVNTSAPCPARPFSSFGTWSATLP